MQELTLTGGTLLSSSELVATTNHTSTRTDHAVLTTVEGNSALLLHKNHNNNNNGHQHHPPSSHTHSHEHDHHHHHHHSGASTTHQKNDCCGPAPPLIRPVLKLKKSAIELATEYSDDQMYQTVQQVVRMGGYELLPELVDAWRQHRIQPQPPPPPESNRDTTSTISTTSLVDDKLHSYDALGHTLTHWAAKRVDDVRFLQYFLKEIPYRPDADIDENSNHHNHHNYDEDGQEQQSKQSVLLYPTPVHRPTRDETKMTPLHWACTLDGALPVIKALLDHAAAVSITSNTPTTTSLAPIVESRDATGCTPLLIAAQHGHVQTCAYLLQRANADLQAVDHCQDSATHWASYKGSELVLGLLSYYDTRQLVTPDVYGQTPLHLAALRGHVSVCRYICQQLLLGETQQQPRSSRRTGLNNHHNSTLSRRRATTAAAVRELKELLYLKDQNGRTPYELAVHKDKPAVAAMLQAQADDLMKRSSGWTYWLRRQAHRLADPQRWKQTCRLRTLKVWMGLPEVEDLDESPRFPFYYVVASLIGNLVYYLTVFAPIDAMENGVLWDLVGLHIVNIFWIGFAAVCLWKCSAVDPGRLDSNHSGIDRWRRLYEQTLDAYANDDHDLTVLPNIQLCHTCHIARPPRSKHDRFSRSCILGFDHHCPFVGATVGLYNYKWFYGFLVALSAYFVSFWMLLILFYRRIRTVQTTQLVIGIYLGCHAPFPLVMLVMHTQLIYVNLTTNEHLNRSRYDYLWSTPESPSHNNNHNTSGSSSSVQPQQPPRRFYNPWDKGCVGNFFDRLFPGDHCYMLPTGRDRTAELELRPLVSQQHDNDERLSSPHRRWSSDVV